MKDFIEEQKLPTPEPHSPELNLCLTDLLCQFLQVNVTFSDPNEGFEIPLQSSIRQFFLIKSINLFIPMFLLLYI